MQQLPRNLILCIGTFISSPLLGAEIQNPEFYRIQPDTFGANMSLSNAWGDYDNDGDLDLVVAFKNGDVRLYNNALGGFTNVGQYLGLPTEGKERRSIAWGDYNADGYLDLFIGTNRQGNELYRNDQSQAFVEVTEELGVGIPRISARQISWVDFDNNGTLDLFVADRVGPNALFVKENNVFIEISQKVGLDDDRATVGACWFDYNQDGLLDLFLANQGDDMDALYRNNGENFVDVAAELGLEGGYRTSSDGGVDCSVADFNNDGQFDLFVATYGYNKLYKNDGRGGFSDVTEAMGLTGNDHMVGASWGDYNNDGWIDLFVAGYHDGDVRSPHDRLYQNQKSTFREINLEGNALNGADHGIQWADFDSDGDLDISLTEGYNIAGRHPVLVNNLDEERRVQSLAVNVSNDLGIFNRAGSEVRIYDLNGRLLGSRLVTTGDGYNSQSNKPVHFGLPNVNTVNLEVTFLAKGERKIQRYENIRIDEYANKQFLVRQSNDTALSTE